MDESNGDGGGWGGHITVCVCVCETQEIGGEKRRGGNDKCLSGTAEGRAN